MLSSIAVMALRHVCVLLCAMLQGGISFKGWNGMLSNKVALEAWFYVGPGGSEANIPDVAFSLSGDKVRFMILTIGPDCVLTEPAPSCHLVIHNTSFSCCCAGRLLAYAHPGRQAHHVQAGLHLLQRLLVRLQGGSKEAATWPLP